MVSRVKFNSFMVTNEHPERICLYLVRQFDEEPSKIGLIFKPAEQRRLLRITFVLLCPGFWLFYFVLAFGCQLSALSNFFSFIRSDLFITFKVM